MTNLVNNAIVRSIFGKASILGFLTIVMAVASFAQHQTNVYYQGTANKYGRVYAYDASHFTIVTKFNTEVKTFAHTCRNVTTANGVGGVKCTFGEFRNGQHELSGESYFFLNGYVYLRWTNEKVAGGQWRNIDTGWYLMIPGA